MSVLENVYQLFGGPAVTRRALHLRGYARLYAVRMRNLGRAALRSRRPPRRSAQGKSPREGIGCSWLVDEPVPQDWSEARQMEQAGERKQQCTCPDPFESGSLRKYFEAKRIRISSATVEIRHLRSPLNEPYPCAAAIVVDSATEVFNDIALLLSSRNVERRGKGASSTDYGRTAQQVSAFLRASLRPLCFSRFQTRQPNSALVAFLGGSGSLTKFRSIPRRNCRDCSRHLHRRSAHHSPK